MLHPDEAAEAINPRQCSGLHFGTTLGNVVCSIAAQAAPNPSSGENSRKYLP